MLINLRKAVLSLVAGSMFATSAQAGHFGGLPHIGGSGGGFSAAAKGVGNFKKQASNNFGSLQKMGQRSSGGGVLNNAFKGQGQANLAQGFGQNANMANSMKNLQSTSHNSLQNNSLSSKLNSGNPSQGGSQSLFGKLNQKGGATTATNAAGNATGSSHQSFMDKLNHKNGSQTQANAAKSGNTTTPAMTNNATATGTNGTTGTNATQTATNGTHKNTHDFGISTGVTNAATNVQNQVNAAVQQAQGQAQAGAAATGTANPTGGNIGAVGNAGGNAGTGGVAAGNGGVAAGTGGMTNAGTGGMAAGNGGMAAGNGGMTNAGTGAMNPGNVGMNATNGGTGGMAGMGGNGMGNGMGGGFSNGGNANFNSFSGGGFLPTVVGALASGGGFGGGYGGGYSAPAYVESAPQYVEAPAPQYVQTAAVQSAPAMINPVSTTAATIGSPVIASVEPLQGAESQVLVRGSGFGTGGKLALDVNGVQLVLDAAAWTPNVIIANVPTLNVANDAAVHFTAVRIDGESSQPFDPSSPTVVASR